MSNQENHFLGTLPKSIILAMTENSAFSGAYNKNPFAFKHFNLEFMALYRDGIQIPSKPLQPEYENGSAVRDFYQLVLSTGRHLKNNPLAIDRQDFLNGYTLYGFNLSHDEDCSNHVSLTRSGNIRLEARFRQPLSQSITIIVYAIFDSIIEISNRRQVLIDYY